MMDDGQSRGTNAGTSTTRGVSSNGGVRPVRVAVVVVILLFGFSARRRELRECDSTSGVLAHTTHPLLRGGYNARGRLSALTVWGLEASGGSDALPWLVTRSGGLCGQWVLYPDFPETRKEVSGPQVGDQVAVSYFVMRSACEYQEYHTVTLGFALKYEYTNYKFYATSVSRGRSNTGSRPGGRATYLLRVALGPLGLLHLLYASTITTTA